MRNMFVNTEQYVESEFPCTHPSTVLTLESFFFSLLFAFHTSSALCLVSQFYFLFYLDLHSVSSGGFLPQQNSNWIRFTNSNLLFLSFSLLLLTWTYRVNWNSNCCKQIRFWKHLEMRKR